MVTHVEVAVGDRTRTAPVDEGESWWAGACRLTPDVLVEPVPVDLSTPRKRFTVDADLRCGLRPLVPGDLPTLARWRAESHVARWWSGEGPSTSEAVNRWVWEVNGRSVGLVQDYRISDHPDYALLTPDPTAVGVDYLIGEPEWVGRGLGTRCLWAWVLHARARHREVRSFFAAPDHRNRASLRVLAKLGFTEGLWFDEPRHDGSSDTVIGCTLDVRQVVG